MNTLENLEIVSCIAGITRDVNYWFELEFFLFLRYIEIASFIFNYLGCSVSFTVIFETYF